MRTISIAFCFLTAAVCSSTIASADIYLADDLDGSSWGAVDEIDPNREIAGIDRDESGDLRKTKDGNPLFQSCVYSREWARSSISTAQENIENFNTYKELYGSDWKKQLNKWKVNETRARAIMQGRSVAISIDAQGKKKDYSSCKEWAASTTQTDFVDECRCFLDWSGTKEWLVEELRSRGFSPAGTDDRVASTAVSTVRSDPEQGVEDVQAVLMQCGFNPGPIDGLWGKKTARAATKFLQVHGESPASEEKAILMAQVDGYRIGDQGPCPQDTTASGEGKAGDDKMEEAGADPGRVNLSDVDCSRDSCNFKGENLAGADLSDADLKGADLSEANLSGTKLVGADLSEANLSGANFRGANLRGAILDHVNAVGANFRDAAMNGASFRNAILDKADMVKTDLRNTLMKGASLTGTALGGARFSPTTGLTMAQLSVANWAGKITEWAQNQGFENLESGIQGIMQTVVEKDGNMRFLLSE